MDPITIASMVMGGAGLFGNLFGPNLDAWKRDALINVFNQLQNQGNWGIGRSQQMMDPLFSDLSVNTFGRAGNMLWDQFPNLQQDVNNFQNSLGDLYFGDLRYSTPGLQAGLDALGGIGGTANQVFQGGGWTPAYQQMQDTAFGLMGGMDPAQRTMANIGGNLMNTGGATNFTRNAADRSMDVMNAGGFTPSLMDATRTAEAMYTDPRAGTMLNPLFQAGQRGLEGMFGVGGMTPTGATGEAVALEELLAGGETPLTNALQDFGMEQATKDQLLSPQQMMGFARENALNAIQNRAQAARRQALARGGSPGSTVGAGVRNQGLADFANEAASAESQAVRDALLARQELGLRQAGQAGQAALGAGGLEATRMGTAGDLMSRLEGVATQRFGTSGGLMSDAEKIATQRQLAALGFIPEFTQAGTQRAGTFGQLGLGAGELENARMGTGLQALTQLLGSEQAALQALGSIHANQNQYALGAGNLGLNAANTGFGNELQLSQFGLNRNQAFNQAMNQNFANRQAGMNFLGNMYNQGLDPLTRMALAPMNYAQSMFGSMPGLFSSYQPGENRFQQAAGGLAQGWQAGQSGRGR